MGEWPEVTVSFPLRLRGGRVGDLVGSDALEGAVARPLGRAFARARDVLAAVDVAADGVVLHPPELVAGVVSPPEEAALLALLARAIQRVAQAQALAVRPAGSAGPAARSPWVTATRAASGTGPRAPWRVRIEVQFHITPRRFFEIRRKLPRHGRPPDPADPMELYFPVLDTPMPATAWVVEVSQQRELTALTDEVVARFAATRQRGEYVWAADGWGGLRAEIAAADRDHRVGAKVPEFSDRGFVDQAAEQRGAPSWSVGFLGVPAVAEPDARRPGRAAARPDRRRAAGGSRRARPEGRVRGRVQGRSRGRVGGRRAPRRRPAGHGRRHAVPGAPQGPRARAGRAVRQVPPRHVQRHPARPRAAAHGVGGQRARADARPVPRGARPGRRHRAQGGPLAPGSLRREPHPAAAAEPVDPGARPGERGVPRRPSREGGSHPPAGEHVGERRPEPGAVAVHPPQARRRARAVRAPARRAGAPRRAGRVLERRRGLVLERRRGQAHRGRAGDARRPGTRPADRGADPGPRDVQPQSLAIHLRRRRAGDPARPVARDVPRLVPGRHQRGDRRRGVDAARTRADDPRRERQQQRHPGCRGGGRRLLLGALPGPAAQARDPRPALRADP